MNYKAIGSYKVYENGTVVSAKTNKVLKPMTSKNGYKHVQLRFGNYGNSYYKSYTVHRLVATLFIENPENKPEIDHIDGNKANNAVSNLRWTDHITNCNNPNTIKKLLGKTPYVYTVKRKHKLANGMIKEYVYVSLQK